MGLSLTNQNNAGSFNLSGTTGRFAASVTSVFVNPTLTLGSAVTTVAQSPFSGGGNSYQFSASTNSFISATRYRDWETDRKSTRLNSSHRL